MMAKKVPIKSLKVDPGEILERYRSLVPAETYACILSEMDRPLPQALRVNQLQGVGTANIARWGERYGWELKPVPFCATGWQVLTAVTSPSQTIEHMMGAFYIQEASSMLPPELFEYDSTEPELVLDLAASPGGKTTHLIDRLGDRGLVVANDASRSRIQALRVALDRWGAINTAITCQPGELFGAWFPGVFDKVLIDAPCSMEGLRTAESHPMRPVTSHERGGLASRQVRLLTGALKAVRPGGQVVYSTCTLAPEEDEVVLATIKRHFGSSVEILTPKLDVQAPALALPQAESILEIGRALRIWPHLYNTAGFFAALFRKNSSFGEETVSRPPQRSWLRQGWVQINNHSTRELVDTMRDQYGFDLEKLIERQGLSFWKRDERIQAIPEKFLKRFGDFPVIGCGLEVGCLINGNLQPSHAWAARFAGSFTAGKYLLPEDQAALWMRGSDVHMPIPGDMHQGSVMCLVNGDGQFIGRGKLLAGRIKNLLPRRLVA